MIAMTLYRATYQRPDGRIRGMTFAARDDAAAASDAASWACTDKLLTVKPVRALQTQLTLTGSVA